MFSWFLNGGLGGGADDLSSLAGSEEAAWSGREPSNNNNINNRDDSDNEEDEYELDALPPLYDETPGTLAYFQEFKSHLESQLCYPTDLPPFWMESLETWQEARQCLVQAQKFLDDLNKNEDTPKEQIAQAQEAAKRAQEALDACNETVRMVGESILTTSSENINYTASKANRGDNDTPCSIPQFISEDFQDKAWVTYVALDNPEHWANWCCPSDQKTPNPTRVSLALNFLVDVKAQRRVLGEGGGGPRGGNYGGYLEILQKLDSSSAAKEPVLERLAHAVALELANGDLCYFDSKIPIDPVARYLHYEQAYLMGDLDPAFSTFCIWELRRAICSSSQDWELQWGRSCLQTYRPDWALTDDVQWRYCRLTRTDVGYMHPTWTSYPRTMDQILDGGGECGPRAWFGRFMCQAFGIPIWGVRQPGHAAMSRWTEKGWMICLGAGFEYSYWEDRCGLDFYLETCARAALPSPTAYLQQVMRLEWLAKYQKESNKSILTDCTYDPKAPWYALSLVQRHLVSQEEPSMRRESYYAPSTRVVPKILRVKTTLPRPKGLSAVCEGEICIPADTTITAPSNNVLIMPCFTGGRQVFLGLSAALAFKLEPRWLPAVPRAYRLTVKVATAHRKDTALLVSVGPEAAESSNTCNALSHGESSYRVPLPYSKGLWEDTESLEIILHPQDEKISFQREWPEMYGVSIKEIRLTPC